MDLAQRFCDVAARIGVDRPEGVKLDKIYTIIYASRPIHSTTFNIILHSAVDHDITFLFLNQEYSAVVSDTDIEAINNSPYTYLLACRKRECNCHYYNIASL
jgi:hypothetical protein